ncbi:MAG: hypothetical protein ACOZB3_00310 [Calditrichota bacterium]
MAVSLLLPRRVGCWGRLGLIIYFAVLLPLRLSIAQGCSDAGLCSIPDLKPPDVESVNLPATNRVAIGLTFGQGDESVSTLTPYVSYERSLTGRLFLAAKLTYNSAFGELGDYAGLGDMYVSGGYVLHRTNVNEWSVMLGGKVPLSSADGGDDANALPMDYQASLDSYDLLLGCSYRQSAFSAHIGLQLPMSGENSSTFLANQYPDPRAQNYSSTNRYVRRGDALLRIAYQLSAAGNRLTIKPSLLPIYHLGEDAYTNRSGEEIAIAGSQGLTLNVNVFAAMKINRRQALELMIGMPLVTRDVRPDGLTRSVVAGLEYRIAFN